MIDVQNEMIAMATKLAIGVARVIEADIAARVARARELVRETVMRELDVEASTIDTEDDDPPPTKPKKRKSTKRRGAIPAAQKRGRTAPDDRSRSALPKGAATGDIVSFVAREERGGGNPIAAQRDPINPPASTGVERDETSDRSDDGVQGVASEEVIATSSQPAPGKPESVAPRAGSAAPFLVERGLDPEVTRKSSPQVEPPPPSRADRFARIEAAARARRGA